MSSSNPYILVHILSMILDRTNQATSDDFPHILARKTSNQKSKCHLSTSYNQKGTQ